MSGARLLAPEVDRLVLGAARKIEHDHNRWILEASQKAGLSGRERLDQFAEFLQAGTLTRDIARARRPYAPPGSVDELLDDLIERELIAETDGALRAEHRLEPLLEGIADLRGASTAELWSEQEATAEIAAMGALLVIEAVPPDFIVASAHASLPAPANLYPLLLRRLTTLRYIRQHGHVEAWSSRGLTAPQIVALTRVWRDEEPRPTDDYQSLVDLGYLDPKRDELTPHGRNTRDEIEDDTNQRVAPIFAALDDALTAEFLSALRDLPSGEPG